MNWQKHHDAPGMECNKEQVKMIRAGQIIIEEQKKTQTERAQGQQN